MNENTSKSKYSFAKTVREQVSVLYKMDKDFAPNLPLPEDYIQAIKQFHINCVHDKHNDFDDTLNRIRAINPEEDAATRKMNIERIKKAHKFYCRRVDDKMLESGEYLVVLENGAPQAQQDMYGMLLASSLAAQINKSALPEETQKDEGLRFDALLIERIANARSMYKLTPKVRSGLGIIQGGKPPQLG